MILQIIFLVLGCATKEPPKAYNPLTIERHKECPSPMMFGKGISNQSASHAKKVAHLEIAAQIKSEIESTTIISDHVERINDAQTSKASIKRDLEQRTQFKNNELIKDIGDVIFHDGNYIAVACLNPRTAAAAIKQENAKHFAEFDNAILQAKKAEANQDRPQFAREFVKIQESYPIILPVLSQLIALQGRTSNAMTIANAYTSVFATAKQFRSTTSFAMAFDSATKEKVLKDKAAQAFRNALQEMGVNGDKTGSDCKAESNPSHVASIKVEKIESKMMTNICDLKLNVSIVDCSTNDNFKFVIENNAFRGANSFSKEKACESAIKKLTSRMVLQPLKKSLQYNIPL